MVSTAAFHARVRGSVPGLGGLKETKLFLPHPRVKVSIVGSLRDREVACSASDRQGSNFDSCVWRTVSSQSSHHPQEVLLAQFSLYVHKGGLKPDSFHFCEDKPTIISPFSVPEKSDGGVRLIHDASQPVGDSLNDQATLDTHYNFETVDSAAKLLWPNYYMAKVDLKSAYRSVKISEHSQKFTGLKWIINNTTVFLKDTKLPFGSKLSPGIFHRLGQSVKRMMERRGFRDLVVYLDDFLVIAPTKQECQLALNTLLKLLRQLGFSINWNKVVDPAKQLIFLGIEIDSQAMCLRLPESKSSALKLELVAFSKRHRATKRQLQSLIGKLNWAAAVVRGGRVFSPSAYRSSEHVTRQDRQSVFVMRHA